MFLALRLKDGDLALLPERKIIKASEVAALRTAQDIIDDAHAERERILAEAKSAFETEKAKGFEDGKTEGREHLAQELLDLSSKGSAFLADLESQVPTIVTSIVRRILGAFDDDDLVVRAVAQAMQVFHRRTAVTVHVAPDQYEVVADKIAQLAKDNDAISFLDVVADRSLTRGQTFLESEFGTVDASVDTQLAMIERSMREDLQRTGQAMPTDVSHGG